MRHTSVLVICLALSATCRTALAADPGKSDERDRAVAIQLTISQERADKTRPDAPRIYRLVAVDGDEWSELTSGARVAIPATTISAKSDEIPVASFTYQNIGVLINCKVKRAGATTLGFELRFEDSSTDFSALSSGQPRIVTSALHLHSVLTIGKPQIVGRLAQSDGTIRVIEVLIEPI